MDGRGGGKEGKGRGGEGREGGLCSSNISFKKPALRTDGRTYRRTDRIAISISRVSVLSRDKNDGLIGLL